MTSDHSTLIQSLVAQGWRIEAATTDMTTLVTGNRPNHILHLLLTIVTAGLWLPGWRIIAIRGGEKRQTIAHPKDRPAQVVTPEPAP